MIRRHDGRGVLLFLFAIPLFEMEALSRITAVFSFDV